MKPIFLDAAFVQRFAVVSPNLLLLLLLLGVPDFGAHRELKLGDHIDFGINGPGNAHWRG